MYLRTVTPHHGKSSLRISCLWCFNCFMCHTKSVRISEHQIFSLLKRFHSILESKHTFPWGLCPLRIVIISSERAGFMWWGCIMNVLLNNIFYCQQPEIDSGDQDFTSRNHLFWSRLSPLKGFGLPIIKGAGLYQLILVWRGFIMTVHTVVWVITLIIRFCCSIYHEILLFPKKK